MEELRWSGGGAAGQLSRSWGGAEAELRRIADRLTQRGREPWNISTGVTMKRARPRRVSRTLYNFTGRQFPFRATPDTPPLAAAMLRKSVDPRVRRAKAWPGASCDVK